MTLPISPSFPPMEASCLLKIPNEIQFEGRIMQSLFPSRCPIMQLDADRYVLDREIVISAEIFFRGFIAAHSSGCMRNRPESLKNRSAVS